MVANESPPLLDSDFPDDPYEAEETLSFCDLPIYSDSFKWDDDFSASKLEQSSSSENDDDFFEFSSEDFTSSIHQKEIIFCGKLIPYRDVNRQSPARREKSHNNEKKSRRGSKNEASYLGRVSILASPTKSRWFLFLFGIAKLPREMEMRDIRSRQSKRSPTTMFPSFEEFETTSFKKEKRRTRRRRSFKGLRGLFRAFSCGSRHSEVVAKAAFGSSCSQLPISQG